jgi:hypothetical protein
MSYFFHCHPRRALLRGAGDFLGARQHGYIASVGFRLYTRLLSEAVHRQRLAGRGPALKEDAVQVFSLDHLPVEPGPQIMVSVNLPLGSAVSYASRTISACAAESKPPQPCEKQPVVYTEFLTGYVINREIR